MVTNLWNVHGLDPNCPFASTVSRFLEREVTIILLEVQDTSFVLQHSLSFPGPWDKNGWVEVVRDDSGPVVIGTGQCSQSRCA